MLMKGCVTMVCLMVLLQNVTGECTFHSLVDINSKETHDVILKFRKAFKLNRSDVEFTDLKPVIVSQPREDLMNQTDCGLKYMIKAIELLKQVQSDLYPDNKLEKDLNDLGASVNQSCNYLNSVLGGECSKNTSKPQLPESSFEKKCWCLSILTKFKHFLSSLKKLPCSVSKRAREIPH